MGIVLTNGHNLRAVQGDVELFMRRMGQPVRSWPQKIPTDELQLRQSLIREEMDETIAALIDLEGTPDVPGYRRQTAGAIAAVLDGIADSIYVLLGTAAALGCDTGPVWDEVQRSNMEKANGPVREDGKRLKPEGWEPPHIESIVLEAIQEHEFADKSIR